MDVTTKKLASAAMVLAGACCALPSLAEVRTTRDGQRVECHYEEVATKDGHPIAAPAAGAAVGGIVGHQFGSGKGNTAMTAAGAVGGAIAGKKIDEKRVEDSIEKREVCRPID